MKPLTESLHETRGSKEMLVRDYMTPLTMSVQPGDTLKEIAQLFHKFRAEVAPVIDNSGKIRGIVTTLDFIRATIKGVSLDDPVETIMTSNVVSIREDSPLEEARKIPLGYLPVLAKDNRVVGMITSRELQNAYYSEMQRATDEVKALIYSAHNGIIVVNAFGIIATYNQAAAALIGVSVENALGRPIVEIVSDSGLMRVMATGEAERGCHLMVNGRMVFSNRSPIFEGRKIVGALAILQDTSELSEVAKQLSDAQLHVEDLIAIYENARQGIIVVDADGLVSRVNKSYEDTFGVCRENLIGHPVVEVIEDTKLHTVAQTGIPEFNEIQNYQGRQIIVNRIPVFKNGKLSGAIGEIIFKDIGEANYLLQRLQHLERKVSSYEWELKELRGDKEVVAHNIDSIIGSSKLMVEAKNLAIRAAQSDSNILLLGESGTGKEVFAHAIHKASKRSAMPFVTVNCAAIPAELLESELFGYDEGAFTGAKKGGKKGKFEAADKGTIFLDEIGDMPFSMQAKILRVLENKKNEHVGGNKQVSCDVRIIAATNKHLPSMVQQQTFREDLFYRLNVFGIQLPPLRERREDIGELLQALMPKICRALGVPPKQFAVESMALLREYGWPGNVRELINLLEQLAVTMDSSTVTPRHLLKINAAIAMKKPTGSDFDGERERILKILGVSRGNKALAAKMLGWHRSTLYEKIKKYNL